MKTSEVEKLIDRKSRERVLSYGDRRVLRPSDMPHRCILLGGDSENVYGAITPRPRIETVFVAETRDACALCADLGQSLCACTGAVPASNAW